MIEGVFSLSANNTSHAPSLNRSLIQGWEATNLNPGRKHAPQKMFWVPLSRFWDKGDHEPRLRNQLGDQPRRSQQSRVDLGLILASGLCDFGLAAARSAHQFGNRSHQFSGLNPLG